MKRLSLLILFSIFTFNSCTRFSRSDTSALPEETYSDSRSDNLDTSKYNARFRIDLRTGFETSISAKRSIADFFFYNQERVLAGISTKFDTVNEKVLSNENYTAVSCDFKDIEDWKNIRYDILFYRTNPKISSAMWDYYCEYKWNLTGSEKRQCKKAYKSGDRYLSDSLKHLHDEYSDIFDKVKGPYMVNKGLHSSLGNVSPASTVGDTDFYNAYGTKCYSDILLNDVEASYWHFTDYFKANGQKDYSFVSPAPKPIETIYDIQVEFGFNLGADREILIDNGAYLSLNVETTEQNFTATFTYSINNIYVADCTAPDGADDCKKLEVKFGDNCGRVLFEGRLVYYPTKVQIEGPHVYYRNSATAYSDPRCHYAGEQVMSSNDNVPSSVELKRGVLTYRPYNSDETWQELFRSTGQDFVMEEIK